MSATLRGWTIPVLVHYERQVQVNAAFVLLSMSKLVNGKKFENSMQVAPCQMAQQCSRFYTLGSVSDYRWVIFMQRKTLVCAYFKLTLLQVFRGELGISFFGWLGLVPSRSLYQLPLISPTGTDVYLRLPKLVRDDLLSCPPWCRNKMLGNKFRRHWSLKTSFAHPVHALFNGEH